MQWVIAYKCFIDCIRSLSPICITYRCLIDRCLDFCAVLHTTFVLPSSVLQHEPVSVYRTVFSNIIPSSGAHEDDLRVDIGVATVRFSVDLQEHHGNDGRYCWHGGV